MAKHPSRRQILGAGLGLPFAAEFASASARLPRSGEGRKLLVLGGTRFLGPAVVDEALARGYEVTLFNRGKSNPHLYPDLEKLRGDRDTGDLAALEGRRWDVVVDPSAYLPSHAKAMAELLADQVDHYVLISTCSVYDQVEGGVSNEDSPLIPITPEDEAKVKTIGEVFSGNNMRFYGPLKMRCEEEVEAAMPGRCTTLRPGVIAGRDDPSDRLPYWVVRVAQGGEVLMPNPPEQGLQFTDVRDLGVMSLDFAEQGKAGIFNSIGFKGHVSLQELVHGCKIVLGSDCSFTWADEAFLLENQVRPFSELPFWLPREAAVRFDNAKGIAAGMVFRPIAETISETWAWHQETRGEDYQWRYVGMQPERERELLDEWHSREVTDEQESPEAPGEHDEAGKHEGEHDQD